MAADEWGWLDDLRGINERVAALPPAERMGAFEREYDQMCRENGLEPPAPEPSIFYPVHCGVTAPLPIEAGSAEEAAEKAAVKLLNMGARFYNRWVNHGCRILEMRGQHSAYTFHPDAARRVVASRRAA